MSDPLFDGEPEVEVISDEVRQQLQELGKSMASINMSVQTMRGVRRGIVVRAYEKELERLEDERYKNAS